MVSADGVVSSPCTQTHPFTKTTRQRRERVTKDENTRRIIWGRFVCDASFCQDICAWAMIDVQSGLKDSIYLAAA